MNMAIRYSRTALALCAIGAMVGFASLVQAQSNAKGTAVAYPWVFENGHDTSRSMAITTAEGIARKAGYASVPTQVASADWTAGKWPQPSFGHLPSTRTLRAFGKASHASKVLYGSVSWHTRSIWVNAGPKTISTATVNVYVLDVATGKVTFKKRGVTGRSDEKSKTLKLVGDVLLTPLITVVSGGPATPMEQRAAQIALGLAYHDWVKAHS